MYLYTTGTQIYAVTKICSGDVHCYDNGDRLGTREEKEHRCVCENRVHTLSGPGLATAEAFDDGEELCRRVTHTRTLTRTHTHRSILLPCALRRPAWLPDGGIFNPVAFTACESLCCSFLTSIFESGSTGAKSDQCGLNCRLDEAHVLVVRPAVGAHGVTRLMGLPFRMAICADAHGEIQYGRSPTILLLGVGT